MSKSILQSTKECYLCRRDAIELDYHGELTDKGLDKHHIMFGRGSRQLSEHWGVWVYLCKKHHNEDHGLFAVHYNRALDRILRTDAERAFIERHSFDEWMRVFGKNYLEQSEIEKAEKTKCRAVSKTETIDKMGTLKAQNDKNSIKTECPEGFWFIK